MGRRAITAIETRVGKCRVEPLRRPCRHRGVVGEELEDEFHELGGASNAVEIGAPRR